MAEGARIMYVCVPCAVPMPETKVDRDTAGGGQPQAGCLASPLPPVSTVGDHAVAVAVCRYYCGVV